MAATTAVTAEALGRIARCHAYGDALGAPYEFRFRGAIPDPPELRAWVVSTRAGTHGYARGTVTDDTEMALALAAGLAAGGADAVDRAYLAFVNGAPGLGPCPFLGNTIRAAYKDLKTIDGVERRRELTLGGDFASLQSNGCLMRAWPLAARGLAEAAADCARTNPSPAAVYACAAYWGLLVGRLPAVGAAGFGEALVGLFDEARASLPAAVAAAWAGLASGVDGEARAAVVEAATAPARDVTGDSKGWALHALWVAFRARERYAAGESAASVLGWAVLLGGDTDTNAAIAGAAIGAAGGDADVSALVRRDGAAMGPLLEAAVAGLLG